MHYRVWLLAMARFPCEILNVRARTLLPQLKNWSREFTIIISEKIQLLFLSTVGTWCTKYAFACVRTYTIRINKNSICSSMPVFADYFIFPERKSADSAHDKNYCSRFEIEFCALFLTRSRSLSLFVRSSSYGHITPIKLLRRALSLSTFWIFFFALKLLQLQPFRIHQNCVTVYFFIF